MIAKLLPFVAWFRDYDMNSLKIDAIAGLTVALVLIPQSMAYAQLGRAAGLLWALRVISATHGGRLVRVQPPTGHRDRWRWSP